MSTETGQRKRTDSNAGTGGDDATALLLLHDWPDFFGTLVGTTQMNRHDLIPVALLHRLEAFVAKDTSVGDEHIDTFMRVEGGRKSSLDDKGSVFGRSNGRDGLTSSWKRGIRRTAFSRRSRFWPQVGSKRERTLLDFVADSTGSFFAHIVDNDPGS